MEYYGFAGKILYVDLTSREIREQLLDHEIMQKFTGAWGINYRLLYDLLKPNVDPLSPDNVIVLGVGPLVGTLAASSSKVMATTKFPVMASENGDKYFVSTSCGGSRRFGVMLKNAGYDHIVITGRSQQPCYLRILNNQVDICDASDLWGKKDLYETTNHLMGSFKGCGVIAIGKAGENLVRTSLAMVDGRSSLGKGGFGAVMGSKNLKAIVSYGSGGIKIANKERFLAAVDEQRKRLIERDLLVDVSEYEAPGGHEGWLPPKFMEAYPRESFHRTNTEIQSCSTCLSPCKCSFEIRSGVFIGDMMRGTHLIVTAAIGAILRIYDIGAMMKLNDMMNRYGLDILTVGRMISFVTRLYARGDISKAETDALELRRDFDCYLKLIDKTANREGLGAAMADGWLALSKKVGIDAREHFDGSPIVKGCNTNGDARSGGGFLQPEILSSVIRPRGVPNLNVDTYLPGRTLEEVKAASGPHYNISKEDIDRIFSTDDFNLGRLTKHCEDGLSVINCLGVCGAGPLACSGALDIDLLAEIYSVATGIELDADGLKKRGEMIYNLERLFNVREGFTREDDAFPPLWVKAAETGAQSSAGTLWLRNYFGKPLNKDDLNQILDDYYDERGWDIANGNPDSKTLALLGLEEFVDLIG